MQIDFVTSFSGEGYEKYGARFVDSWVRNIKIPHQLRAYHHDLGQVRLQNLRESRATYHSLHDVPEHEDFYTSPKPAGWDGVTSLGYNYRLDAKKFSHKMFAIWDTLKFSKADYVVWLDADTEVLAPMDFASYLDHSKVTYLSRDTMNYPETSFLGIPRSQFAMMSFMIGMAYGRGGGLFRHKEWHDGWLVGDWAHDLENFKSVTKEGLGDLAAFEHTFSPYLTHYKGELKNMQPTYKTPMKGPQARPVKIEPKDCVPQQEILDHIVANEGKIKKWITNCRLNNDVVFALSAGPSLLECIPEIKEQIAEVEASGRKARVICVKHSHNLLIENGIIPWACILLDPRPYQGLSTSGHKRSDLLAEPHPDCTYIVATMVFPEVLDHLISKGAKILGWDAFTNAIKDRPLPQGRFWITGGTCSAMRILGVGHVLGFREYRLWGYDGCVYELPDPKELDEQGRPKWLHTKIGTDPEGPTYYTTGEWLAMGQDFENLMKEINAGKLALDIRVGGRGIIAELYKKMSQPNYEDILP